MGNTSKKFDLGEDIINETYISKNQWNKNGLLNGAEQ